MLSADLRARLVAAGLPTDLEGMLEAAAALHPTLPCDLAGNFPGWVFGFDGDAPPTTAYQAATPAEAVARWLLAAKEAQHG